LNYLTDTGFFYNQKPDKEGAKDFLSERFYNKDSEIFVAEVERLELSGFVQLYPLFSSFQMSKLWMLNDLFGHTEFRQKGISIGLIEKVKKLVINSNACGMFLETEKPNTAGNNLYPKTGFELNTVENYYSWYVNK